MSEQHKASAPRRICFCNTNASWGGGEQWHLTFAKALQANGWDTQLLGAKGGALARRAHEAGLEVAEIPGGRLQFLHPLRMLGLLGHFRKYRPQALVLGLPQDLKAAGLAASRAGVPLILYRRGMGLTVRDSAFNRHLYRNVAHGVIVNARDTRRALLAENPHLLPQERIHLLRNGVDQALLEQPYAPFPLIAEEEGRGCVIGTAGRLVPQKGHSYLIKALALLREQGVQAQLRIAGEGPLQGELEALAAAQGVGDAVRFEGFVQDMRSFYDSLHVFAFPSLWEGMSNAVLEAMAAGRPVAGFAVSSMPEVVRHGETGLLVTEKDVGALSQALGRLCQEPPLRVNMGLAGRERVRQEFLLQDKIRRFEALVLRLLDDEGATL